MEEQQWPRMVCSKRELKEFFGIGEKKLNKWIREYGCPAYPDDSGQYRSTSKALSDWYMHTFGPRFRAKLEDERRRRGEEHWL
ncbi:hypothetical protein JCM16814_29960 [Desulfobaculum senezii]